MWHGALWRHTNNRDVAFEVLKSYLVREKNLWKLKVTWWNIGVCHKPWPMRVGQTLELTVAAANNWHPMGFHDELSTSYQVRETFSPTGVEEVPVVQGQ